MRCYMILFFLLMNLTGFAKEIIVCESCTLKDLKTAISTAAPGDSIILKKGTYEAVDINLTQPISISSREGAILDGRHQSYIFKILSEDIRISGLTFVNSGRSYTKDYAAIYAYRAHNFSITRNTIINPFFGILLEKSDSGKVVGNTIYGESVREDDSGNGIHLWHCSHMEILNNDISKLRDGIYLEFVSDSHIGDNHSHNNVRYGLHFMFSNHDRYTNNIFERNGAGVAVMFSKYILMSENKFVNNWGTTSYGLLLKEIYDADVENNKFRENTIGIFVEGSTRINYTGNDYLNNGWAIKVSGGCYQNIFEKNNFIGNSFDISYNGKINDNRFNKNYWSSYSGYDMDKNGVGDVPYRPVKLFSYVVNRTPESLVLLRSLFIDIVNYSEKVSPIFTPDNLIDQEPQMNEVR